jgi:hypothetical protein
VMMRLCGQGKRREDEKALGPNRRLRQANEGRSVPLGPNRRLRQAKDGGPWTEPPIEAVRGHTDACTADQGEARVH